MNMYRLAAIFHFIIILSLFISSLFLSVLRVLDFVSTEFPFSPKQVKIHPFK